MENVPVEFSKKMQWIKKSYFFMGFAISIILVCAYLFAWIRGANAKEVMVSGLCLFIFNILFFVFLYIFTIYIAKRFLKTKWNDFLDVYKKLRKWQRDHPKGRDRWRHKAWELWERVGPRQLAVWERVGPRQLADIIIKKSKIAPQIGAILHFLGAKRAV